MLGDGAGMVLDANPQALELFGYTLEEMRTGRKWLICDPSDPRFHESVHTRASSGRSDFQMRLVRKDGSVFEGRIWSILFEEDGQRRSWIGVTPVGASEPSRSVLLRANAMLSAVIAGAPDGIIVVDDDGNVAHVNDVFLKMWNLDRDFTLLPVAERRAAAAVLLKDPEPFLAEIGKLEAERDLVLRDYLDFVDGRTIEMHSQPLHAPGGERIGRIWYYSDVTDVLDARRLKEHVDAVLDAHFSLSMDGLLVVDDDGNLLRASKVFQELEVDGKRWVDLPFEEREEALRARVKDKELSRSFVERWLHNPDDRLEEIFELVDGRFREVRSMPLYTAAGRRLGRQFIYRDVTLREQARIALEKANTLLTAQFEHAPHATLVLASDGSFIRASNSFFELTGLSPDWAELPQHERRAHLQAIAANSEKAAEFNARWRNEPDDDLSSEFKLRDGRYFEVQSRPLRSEDGQTLGRTFFYTDITERRRAEIVLRESEEQLRALLGSLEEGVVLHDATGAIVLANAAAERVLGLPKEQLLGRVPADPRWRAVREDGSLLPGEQHPASVTLRTGEAVTNMVMGVHRPSGEDAWLLVNSAPLFEGANRRLSGCVASFFDITERRKLEAQAARSRQQESLSVLAGGISHKLNNLLTSILGNTWVASRTAGQTPELRSSLEDISQAAEAAAALVGDLQSFAAPSYLLSPNVSINDCVRAAVDDIPSERRERLALSLGAALPHISANADGLRRAVVNLMENAFESGSPTVEIRTRMMDWRPAPGMVFSAAEPEEGEWLAIEVEDRGSGMSRIQLERAFEPFFTTGFAGSGLGLPAATGIVREHGGFVGLESREREGTVARIFLPPGR